MTLREWSAVVVAILSIVAAIWYVYLMFRDKVKPVLPAWIVFGATMGLSCATYFTTPKSSVISNAALIVGAGQCVVIMIFVIALTIIRKTSISFSRFQRQCLGTAFAIAVLWAVLVWGLGRTGFWPYILIQILMAIGYVVNIQKVWRATVQTESITFWVLVALASLIGVYTSIASRDELALVYAVRASITTIGMLWALMRIERVARSSVPVWSI